MNLIVSVLKNGYVTQVMEIADGKERYLKAPKSIVKKKRLPRRRGAKFEKDFIEACKIIGGWRDE